MAKHDARLTALAFVLAGLSLTGCGKAGPLQQPPPMFGDRAKADYEARRAADAAAKAEKQERQKAPVNGNAVADQPDPPPATDNAPRTKRDIQDPNQRLTPLAATPVDGSPNLMGAPVSTRPPN
jgi:predicted small lipoprotein YifL